MTWHQGHRGRAEVISRIWHKYTCAIFHPIHPCLCVMNIFRQREPEVYHTKTLRQSLSYYQILTSDTFIVDHHVWGILLRAAIISLYSMCPRCACPLAATFLVYIACLTWLADNTVSACRFTTTNLILLLNEAVTGTRIARFCGEKHTIYSYTFSSLALDINSIFMEWRVTANNMARTHWKSK